MEALLNVTGYFFHAAIKIVSLSYFFCVCHFNYMVDLFGLILFRTLWYLDLDVCFLSQVREVSARRSLDMFFAISLALLLGPL